MDVLRPEVVWIEGRCYRFSDSSCWSSERGSAAYEEESLYAQDYEPDDEDPSDKDIQIEQTESGRFKHVFHVPRPYFPFIIGRNGSTRSRIAADTKTSIKIPRQGQDGDIEIIGSDRRGVVSARRRIDMVVATSRKKLQFTHFISIPMNNDMIISGFNSFKDDVLSNVGKTARGVDETIFQNPHKLHLTIALLILLDDKERQQAAEALEYCKEHIIQPILKKHGPICVQLQGVECMNDDPAEVKVLYAKVATQGNILQELADKVMDHFVHIGLMTKQNDSVKLHATFMNTKFKGDGKPVNYKARETFDATNILKAHGNTRFGEIAVDSIHISQRHTVSKDMYYQATAKIALSDC